VAAHRDVLLQMHAIGQLLQERLILELDLQTLVDVGLAGGGHLGGWPASVER
jgi:hypothetical protein